MSTIRVNSCYRCNGACDACFQADLCPRYLGTGNSPAQETVDCARLALCESRHPMPAEVEGAIFPQTITDPTDFGAMRLHVARTLRPIRSTGIKFLVVYVTGLTPALVEVINWCRCNGMNLILMHFDLTSGKYVPQSVA